MLDIGSRRGWTVVLLVMIVIGLIPLIPMVAVDRWPAYFTTGILRVSPVLPPQLDPNDQAEMTAFMAKYEAYKNTVAIQLTSDRVLSEAAGNLAELKLNYFHDDPNRVEVLRQAIKRKRIVIEVPRQSDRITVRMISRSPKDAEAIVNCMMAVCVEVENLNDLSVRLLEYEQKLWNRLKRIDQKDEVKLLYDATTRRIDKIRDQLRPPGLVQIDSRAQSVPTVQHWKRWITLFTVIEALLVLALIGNLLWRFLRPPGPYQSPSDNT